LKPAKNAMMGTCSKLTEYVKTVKKVVLYVIVYPHVTYAKRVTTWMLRKTVYLALHSVKAVTLMVVTIAQIVFI
jgi:hypothetical protein